MDRIKEFLASIGFGKNETEIYVNLISMGTSSVLDIAKKTKIHRSNIYDSLRSLVEEGLVYEINGPTKLFRARPPKSLIDYMMNRKAELEELLKEFEVRNVSNKQSEKVLVSKGLFAVREAIFNLLESGQEILTYGIPGKVPGMIGPRLGDFHKERIKKGIKMKHIYNSDGADRVSSLNKMQLTEARILPKKYDSGVNTIICGDKVTLVFWNDDIMVIEIIDPHFSEPYMNYFDLLWKKAKTVGSEK